MLRTLLLAALTFTIGLLALAAPTAADPAPTPYPWCEPVAGSDPVFDEVANAVNTVTGEACHVHNCIAYSYGKIALIRRCLGV